MFDSSLNPKQFEMLGDNFEQKLYLQVQQIACFAENELVCPQGPAWTPSPKSHSPRVKQIPSNRFLPVH